MQVYGFDYNNIFFLLSVDAINPVNPGTTTTNLTINSAYSYDPLSTTLPFGNPHIPSPGNSTV